MGIPESSKKRMGRPSEYSQEVADAICAGLSEGRSLRSVCKAEDMPCIATVYNWFRANPEFLEQYARAKEESADAHADDIIDIADDGSNDWMERFNSEGEAIGWQLNGEHVQRSRLRIETRKWLASKLKAKKYGDKVEHGGKVEHAVNITFAVPQNDYDAI